MAEDTKIYQLKVEIGDSKKSLQDLRLEMYRVNNEYKKGNLTKEEAKKKTTDLKDQIIDETKKLQDLNRELENEKKALEDLNKSKEDEVKTTDELTKSTDEGNKSFANAVFSVKNLNGAFKGLIRANIASMFTKLVSSVLQANGALEKLENYWKNTAVYQTLFKTNEKEREEAAKIALKNSKEELKNAEEMSAAYEFSLLPAEEQRTKLKEKQAENQKKLANVEEKLKNTELTQVQRNELLASKNNYLAEEEKYKTNIKQLDNEIAEEENAAQEAAKKAAEDKEKAAQKAIKAELDANQKYLDGLDKTIEKEEELRKKNADKVKALNDELFAETLDEHQRKLFNIQQEYNERIAAIKELAEAGAISAAEQQKLEAKVRDNRKRKEQEAANEVKQTWQDAYSVAAESAINQADIYSSATINTIKAIGAIRNKDDKEAFKMNQVLEIGATVNDTIAGSAMAFIKCLSDYGLPYGAILGGIAAGSATASGVAAIAKIKSQKFGGGGGSASSSTPARSVSIPQETTTTSKIQGVQSDLAMAGQTRSILRSEERQTQTVLVVDDVTAKQNSQNLIQKTSVM